MKKTLEERIKFFLLKIGRKNRFLGIMVFPFIFLNILFFHILKYIKGNGKRIAMLCTTAILFAVYSSFSFPAFMHETDAPSLEEGELSEGEAEAELGQGEYEVYLMEENEISLEEAPLLEDEDVMEEYEDAELHGIEDVDKYAVDEILEYNGERNFAERDNKREEEDVSFTRDDWRLILINKQHPIPEDYTFTLGTITGSMKCDERIIDDLLAMLQGAKNDGVQLIICSPYRDMERQVTLFNRKINRYMNMGMSYMDAYKLSSQSVTVPGASEHQIGLALDIVTDYYTSLEVGFGETEAGIWLEENCAEYGFILRYPEGKEYITGIQYEPWHFRYVGVDAARVIMESGITLEEFWEDL
ncbi:M15 family metallopeptidase [Lachnospiraceae bacterium OttesenSCG-928-D06]|nr:M15 family metallopeptidase [Lachnospiraceae bacterium OttesenSCG-928-D06]